MGIKCGIVGLPNVGKSTLFNALTKAGIAAANFPFCTIEPNVGIVPVPDPRLNELAGIINPQKVIPTAVEFVDIAGLVAGAASGEGRATSSRRTSAKSMPSPTWCAASSTVTSCTSPARSTRSRTSKPSIPSWRWPTRQRREGAEPCRACSQGRRQGRSGAQAGAGQAAGGTVRRQGWSFGRPDDEEKALVRDLFLLTLKPVMYIANVLEDGFENNPHLEAVRAHAAAEGAQVVPVSAAIEEELSQLDDEDRDTFLADLGLSEPGLNRVINAAYSLLGLQTYFTAGVKEVRAWTVRKGATAPQAAAVIHTDFEKGFIRAETIAYDDFIKYKGEAGAKEAGRLRPEGKEYRVQEGDILHFRFNV